MGLFDDLLAAEAEVSSTPHVEVEIPELKTPQDEVVSANPEAVVKTKKGRKPKNPDAKPRAPRKTKSKLPTPKPPTPKPPTPEPEQEPEPETDMFSFDEDAAEFDRLLDDAEPEEIEPTRADKGLRELQSGARKSAARKPVEDEDLEFLEELRADPDRAGEADEFERALEEDGVDARRFDELATRMAEDNEEDDDWMSTEERSKMEAKVASLSKLNGVDLPRGWRKRSNADLRQLELELRGNQKSRLFSTGVRKAYFTSLSVVEALGPKATFLGPEGLCVEGLTDALEGDEFVEEALQMISQDLEEQYGETMSPGVMLAVATAAAVTRLHASNLSARRALRVAPPSLVEKLSKLPPAPPIRGSPAAAPSPAQPQGPTQGQEPTVPQVKSQPQPTPAPAAAQEQQQSNDIDIQRRTLEALKTFAPKTTRM